MVNLTDSNWFVMKNIELIKNYFPGKSNATMSAYAVDLDCFAGYLGVESTYAAVNLLLGLPESQANLLVLHYKSELLQTDLKTTTVNRRLSTIRSLIKKARTLGLIDWSIDVSNETETAAVQVAGLSNSDIRRLMKAVLSQSSVKKATRDYAMLRLIYDLALKRHMLVALQLSDLDLNRKTLAFPNEKKEKRLTKPAHDALQKWIKQRGNESGPLFMNSDSARKKCSGITATSIYRIFRGLGNSIGLQVTPEAIRNSAIAEVVKQAKRLGVSEHELLTFSNHKNTQSLKKYQKHQQKIQESLSNLVATIDPNTMN
jgi:integrase/recombinase XerC